MMAPHSVSAQYVVNGNQFSAVDSDNDAWPAGNCAAHWGCGWWYEMCSTSHVNRDSRGFWSADDVTDDVEASRMLVRVNSG